jgi:hypothetical protein
MVESLSETDAVAGSDANVIAAPRTAKKAKIIIHPNMPGQMHVTGQCKFKILLAILCQRPRSFFRNDH